MAEALQCMRNAAEVYRKAGDTYWLPIADARINELAAALNAMQNATK